jgi:DNA-binding response OmpR family regulator
MLTPATCWYFGLAFRSENSVNETAMNGNVYEIQKGLFKGRSSNSKTGRMKNGKIRVLLVQEEMPLAMWMVFVLTRVGCDVDAVHTAKKGLKLASEKKFDLIALDTKFSDACGFSLCSELKQRHISRKTPIIFISASPDPGSIAESKTRGAVDYITKPFEITDFIYRIILHARAKPTRTGTSV